MEVKIWDPTTNTEQILTIADFQAQDWENLTGEELYRKFPGGTSLYDVVNLLVQQLGVLSKKVKALENEVTDKILLEDSPKP